MPLERVTVDKSPHYPGEVRQFSCLALPSGWLPPDGQAVSRTLYPRLFAAYVNTQQARVTSGSNTMICTDSNLFAIGCFIVGSGVPANTRVTGKSGTSVTMSANATATTAIQNYIFHLYGLGDGSTTFNLPDYRGRTLIDDGAGAGLANRMMNDSGGNENHTLTQANLPNINIGGGNVYNVGQLTNGGSVNRNLLSLTPSDVNQNLFLPLGGSGQGFNIMQPFATVQLGIFAG